jgi:hypothetical protein
LVRSRFPFGLLLSSLGNDTDRLEQLVH